MTDALTGRTAIVTGGSRGLGAAIATSLGRRGARVAVNCFRHPEKAERVCETIRSAGGEGRVFPADVTEEQEIDKLVAGAREAFGPVDILVPNATGPQPFLPLEQQTWDEHLRQLSFFVKSPLLLTRAVVEEMKSRRFGRIVHVGSEAFEDGVVEFGHYVSAKGAQLGLTRSWAKELAPWGITVNLVAPGWIPTERHADVPEEAKRRYAEGVPLGRQGIPEDVGEAVAYLASDAANFITGQKLAVNGGHTLA